MLPIKLAIIERDGIVGQSVAGQLTGHADWHGLPGAAGAIARMNQAGWHVALIASQPGLGRGLYDGAALSDYHRQMYKELAAVGARVDAVFFCPHAPGESCDCWQPQAALLRQITERYKTEPDRAVYIGLGCVADDRQWQTAASIGLHMHRIGPECADSSSAPPTTSHASLAACTLALLPAAANA